MSNWINKDNETDFDRAKFLAFKYLSYKSHTEKEVADKLRSYKEFDEDIINETIGTLKSLGYINDSEYAQAYAMSKSRHNLDGSYKIKQKLRSKGIEGEISFDELGINEVSNAVKLIRKRFHNFAEPDDANDTKNSNEAYKEKQKVYSYLARKGYSISVINKAFNALNCDLDVDWEDIFE